MPNNKDLLIKSLENWERSSLCSRHCEVSEKGASMVFGLGWTKELSSATVGWSITSKQMQKQWALHSPPKNTKGFLQNNQSVSWTCTWKSETVQSSPLVSLVWNGRLLDKCELWNWSQVGPSGSATAGGGICLPNSSITARVNLAYTGKRPLAPRKFLVM